MRKLGLILTPAFVAALALSAVAQEKPLTTKKENDGTVKVNVSGKLALDYVWRSKEMEAIVVTLGTAGSGESENTFEGYAAIRFDVELTDKVSTVIEIGTERVDDGILAWGQTSANGVSAAQDVVLREAHLLLGDFLAAGLRAQLGIETWTFDVRGKGSSFAFDPRHSQSFARNVTAAGPDTTLGLSAPEELQPVGAVLTYERDALLLDLVILPAVIEAGPASDDESLYAADLHYKLDGKGSRVSAILALVHVAPLGAPSGEHSNIFTLGGGAVLKGLVENLELWGEVYFQFGEVTQDVDATGLGFQAGAEFMLQNAIKLGGIITFVSGDDDADDEVGNFLSYENINDLMILEDQYYGFDWDHNYLAFKFYGEVPLDVRGKGDLVLKAILGIANAVEDIEFATGNNEDALGVEFDVRARWAVTKQASLHAGVGLLFGSDALEEDMGGSANDDADDNARLFVLGFDVIF
jgi:hypothetical protein